MNKLLNLALVDFKILTKSKSFYLKLILFPTILILILGTVFGKSDIKVPSFEIAFYSEDTNVSLGNDKFSLGDVLKDNILKSDKLKSMITLKEVSTYNEGEKLVNDNKVATFIYIPKDFSSSFINNSKTNITLLGNKENPIDKSIVKNILDRFIQTTKTVFIEQKEVMTYIKSNNTLSKDAINKVLTQIKNNDSYYNEITKSPTSNNVVSVSSMQYYSIAMVVMFSILTAFTLVHNIVDDKLNNTLARIKSTPTLNLQYILAKLLGIVFTVLIQMSILIVLTSLVFKMNWGNPLYILLITIIYSFAIGSFTLIFGLIAKNQTTVSSISTPILYGFSFLGGSFISKYSFPDTLKTIQQIIPNGKAINSYLRVCQGGNLGDIYKDLIELLILGTVFLIMSLLIYNGRKGINDANSNNDSKAVKATA